MAEFKIEIVEAKAIKTAGLKVSTTMKTAAQDCPKVWDKFIDYMAAFLTKGAFGISVLTSLGEGTFDYYAAMELSPKQAIPEDLEAVDLPAGTYAKLPLKNLEEMGEAYPYIFEKWLPNQSDWACAPLPGYERYEDDHLETGALVLFIPLVKK